MTRHAARCLFVTHDQVYHPDYLLKLPLYRAYYTGDDPGATYQRTIPYVHAFHHMFHCAGLPYSLEKTLGQKLRECGARHVDFLPLGAFDYGSSTRPPLRRTSWKDPGTSDLILRR